MSDARRDALIAELEAKMDGDWWPPAEVADEILARERAVYDECATMLEDACSCQKHCHCGLCAAAEMIQEAKP